VFQRLTQTEEYWNQDFTINADDLDHLHNRLLEEERPLALDSLAMAIMINRIDQEQAELQRLLARGTLYKPENSYSVGETLVFPALDFGTATVIGTRQGYNPEFGEFQVIEVQFNRTKRKREFASGLDHFHALNAETDNLLEVAPSKKTAKELYAQYGKQITKKLRAALENQADLVQLFGLWFLKALITDIGPGYLNIAEAILDIADGSPLRTEEILGDLGLPAESRPELLEYSLNYALFHDDRFDEVGPAGQVLWYLSHMEPQEVRYPPNRLMYQTIPYSHELLNLNLRRLEQELDDEWSSGWESDGEPEPTSFVLTFPHRHHGTIPLSSRIAPLFPSSYQTRRIRCTFVDGHTGDEMEAWVVWEGRFVYGLAGWYEANQLPIGAILHIAPGSEPGVVTIQYERQRSRREWVRVALVENDDLLFGMQKWSVSCEYDDMMMIGMHKLDDADQIWIKSEEERWSLAYTMVKLFPQLARLSPQNTVHAKTIYSAINMVRRCPPGPIFAELVRQPCFISMGENYWRFNASLWSGG
jgi:hypothetical protein